MSRWRRVALVLPLVACLLLAGCSLVPMPRAAEVGPEGGTVTEPNLTGNLLGRPLASLVVPPGVLAASTPVTVGKAQDVPTVDDGTELIGEVYEITTPVQFEGGEVQLPLDLEAVGAPGERDFYIAIYSEALGIWVPLETHASPDGTMATAVAPHYSKFSVRGYSISDVGEAVGGWVADRGRDALGGVKRTATIMWDGLVEQVVGFDQMEIDCTAPRENWTVTTGSAMNGCVADDHDIRLQNYTMLPFTLVSDAPLDVGTVETDFRLTAVDMIARAAHRAKGDGYIAPVGATVLTIPSAHRAEGTTITTTAAVDQLTLSIQMITGLLSVLPGKKVFTDAVEDRLASGLDLAPDATYQQVLTAASEQPAELAVDQPDLFKMANAFIEVSNCLTGSAGAGILASDSLINDRDPEAFVSALLGAAIDCAKAVLEGADSAMAAVFTALTGILGVVSPIGQLSDAVKFANLNSGGVTTITTAHEVPIVVGLPIYALVPGGAPLSKGLGDERPSTIDLGGGSTSGIMDSIQWESWGGEQAEGSTLAVYDPPEGPWFRTSGRIVAWDPGMCQGQRIYRKLSIWFPQYGHDKSFYPPTDLCVMASNN